MRYPGLWSGLICLLTWGWLPGQAPEKWNSARVFHEIKKLRFLGSALYVAAHPDDENTRLITYLANHRKASTAYISLTRGDGGQNLISPELREMLGLIRTQELLGARQIDGGRQFFSRANDFGFSKHPDETFRIWEKEKVLEDLIAVIRYWQPDVIINRFDHRSPGRTHGHHTASAMLGVQTFRMAADPSVFPKQAGRLGLWQPRRLFFNTSWWFYGSQKAFDEADKSKLLSMEVGVYYPLLGKSNNEIAAESRSMHKSQGFGSLGIRGSETEYLELLEGDMPNGDDLFDGINTTWSRVNGGEKVGDWLKKAEDGFSLERPHEVLPDLLQALAEMEKLKDGFWKREKSRDLRLVIKQCAGLYQEASTGVQTVVPGEAISVQLEFIHRSPVPVTLKRLRFEPIVLDTMMEKSLSDNKPLKFSRTIVLPENLGYTSPYWLLDDWTTGVYQVKDENLRGLPETPRSLKIRAEYLIGGMPFALESDLVFKMDDPVAGEVYQPVAVVPPLTANFRESVNVFANRDSQQLQVVVQAFRPGQNAEVSLSLPPGWSVSPRFQAVQFTRKEEEQTLFFQVTPPAFPSEGYAKVRMETSSGLYDKKMIRIRHAHIPTQTVLVSAQAKVVRIELERAGKEIGYLMGAGDEVPAAISQMGYKVTLLQLNDLSAEKLQRFDAVVLGVRAYNTLDGIGFRQKDLFQYANEGGTVIVQYNTTGDLQVADHELAPFPLTLSRDRITDEAAEVTFLQPQHVLMQFPNRLNEKDFEGWEQERGLYFPSRWDGAFTPLLRFNDPGEKPIDGALLVARYGKGNYIYTGLSFFRELAAGVPGAFRLFANLLSAGKDLRP